MIARSTRVCLSCRSMMDMPEKTSKLARRAAFLWLVTILHGVRSVAVPQDSPSLLVTADTEGHVGPCEECPDHLRYGGLARRAAAVEGARKKSPGVLLVDAGNALFGAESAASRGQVIVSAYNALGYDAVNLSYRDFRLGKAETISLLKEAKFAVLSANLLDGDTGKMLAPPYVVKKADGERIALLGLTESPTGLDSLSHLKEQLAGIKIQPPVEALSQWLPRAKAESDRVLLLYYGSAGGLKPLRERFAADLTAILVGGARPEYLPPAGDPPVIGTGEHGRHLAQLRISGSGAGTKVEVSRIAVEPSLKPAPEMEEALKPYEKKRPRRAGEPALEPRAAAGLPPVLEPDKTYRLELTGQNRGARLAVLTAYAGPRYGETQAPEGWNFLVLDTEWENVIPLTAIENQKVPTEYRIQALGDHLYVVVNGTRVARLHPQENDLPGHLPVKDFQLQRIGAKLRGNAVFKIPAGKIESLGLRFYDYAHGHMALALLAPPIEAEVVQAQPRSPLQKNEVVEAGVFGLIKEEEREGQRAPEGLTFVVADLRARSLFSLDADATAFDPRARPGSKMKVGTVADWKDSRRHLQLVADGEYGYAPLGQSTLPEEPRFLPDVLTGGEVVFLAPEKTASLELRCDFPNAKTPGTEAILHPAGLTIPLEGSRPSLPERQPLASIDDEVFKVEVVGQATRPGFAGEKAGDGEAFLVLEVTVRNTGKKGETFQTKEQLKYAAADGSQLPMDPVTFQGVHHPADLVWIPAGERRSFQAAWRIPAGEKKPRLAYAGVSLTRVVDLSPPDAPLVAARDPEVAETPPTRPELEAAAAAEAGAAAEARAKTVPKGEKGTPAARAKSKRRPAPGQEPETLDRVAARPDQKPKGLAGAGLTAEQVNAAIDKGAAFLWNHIKAQDLIGENRLGDYPEHVLACLALVHADWHRKAPEFDARLQDYLARKDPRDQRMGTYENGLFCMLIEAYGDPVFLPKLRHTARFLLEQQADDGSWAYGHYLPQEIFADPAEDQPLQVHGGVPLEAEAGGTELQRITKWTDRRGDNSTSQFALLGLNSAARCRLKLPAETWEKNLSACRGRQIQGDGSWPYHNESHGYGSMTCAGICAVAINRHQLGEKDPAGDEAIERGLAWLVKNWTLEENPQASGWQYYYLYSLERVGRILDTEFIGPYEWYPLGARYLLDSQQEDGRWIESHKDEDPRLPASFALLFLTRATPTLEAALKREGEGVLKTGVAPAPGMRLHIILDCSGSMLAEMDGRRKFEIAREAVVSIINEVPDDAQVGLRVYGHRKLSIEPGASEDVELLIRLGKLDRQEFLAKLAALRARGKTPLARSLLEARGDLAGASEKDPIKVVLLTDGGEDTMPRQDPVKAAAEFAKLKGVKLQIVGFDINRADWTKQLLDMARLSGGQYLPAAQGEALLSELRSAIFGTPEGFTVYDQDKRAVARGPFGSSAPLPEGKYSLETSFGGQDFSAAFWINTDAATAVIFDAAKVRPEAARAPPAAAPEKPAATPPAPAKKFCTGCGAQLAGGARFCNGCGKKVE